MSVLLGVPTFTLLTVSGFIHDAHGVDFDVSHINARRIHRATIFHIDTVKPFAPARVYSRRRELNTMNVLLGMSTFVLITMSGDAHEGHCDVDRYLARCVRPPTIFPTFVAKSYTQGPMQKLSARILPWAIAN
jgi:hypothetical protein